jgi:hypothetical protein
MGCKYRDEDNCTLTNKICFGAVLDDEKDVCTIDKWQEKRCPSFVDDEKDEYSEITSKTEWNLREGQEFRVVVRIFGRNPAAKRDVEDKYFFPDRTIEEDAEVLESLLNRRYEGGIKVEGINIDSDKIEDFPTIKKIIDEGVELPIATINDELKFIGSIPLELLKFEIEKLGIKPRQA